MNVVRRRIFICVTMLLAGCLENVVSSDDSESQSRRDNDKPCPDKPNIIVIVADDMVSVTGNIRSTTQNRLRACMLYGLIDRDSTMSVFMDLIKFQHQI